jgi:hypothetical protein
MTRARTSNGLRRNIPLIREHFTEFEKCDIQGSQNIAWPVLVPRCDERYRQLKGTQTNPTSRIAPKPGPFALLLLYRR